MPSCVFLPCNNMSDPKEFAVPALPTQKQQKLETSTPALPPSKENVKRTPQPPPLNYDKPSWSAEPSYKYRLEILKNGASLETVQGPRKEFVTIGRLPICDIPMEHPVSFSFSFSFYALIYILIHHVKSQFLVIKQLYNSTMTEMHSYMIWTVLMAQKSIKNQFLVENMCN